jgi:hypothetical protein
MINENILTFEDLAWKIDYRFSYIKYKPITHTNIEIKSV